jgi:hypothetical protein
MGDSDGGVLFLGTKGILMCGCYGKNPQLIPESRMKEYCSPRRVLARIPDGQDGHERDWVRACKRGEPSDSRPLASGDFREGEVSSFGMTASPSRARLYPDLIITSWLQACLVSLSSLRPIRHGLDSGRVSDTIRPRSYLTRARNTPEEHKP